MSGFSTDLIELVKSLMPGFLTAWIFYGLTAYKKPSEFERIVQALVFTGIIHAVVIVIGGVYSVAGYKLLPDGEFLWSWLLAFAIGVSFSALANGDWLHKWLREKDLTANTSYPSQWFYAFKTIKSDVTLVMKDKRRLTGWPFEYTDHPDEGQFRITHARWEDEDGSTSPLDHAECVVIPATDVAYVEFLKCETRKDECKDAEKPKGDLSDVE